MILFLLNNKIMDIFPMVFSTKKYNSWYNSILIESDISKNELDTKYDDKNISFINSLDFVNPNDLPLSPPNLGLTNIIALTLSSFIIKYTIKQIMHFIIYNFI